MTMTNPFQNPERVECVRWSPGPCGHTAAGIYLLLAALVSLPAIAPADELSTAPSVELQYSAAVGQVFELQGSRDLRSWSDVGDVVFGGGERVSELLASYGGSDEFRFYRVKMSPSKAFGFAPTFLHGKRLLCNDEGQSGELRFVSRSEAASEDGPVAYSYRKTGDTSGVINLDLGGGESEVIELDFKADHVGIYKRTRLVGGRLDDLDLGTFALGRNTDPAEDPADPVTPGSLVGRSFLFSDGDNDERLDFVTDESGRAVDRADVAQFDYGYSVAGDPALATATVWFADEVTVEFEMRFGNRSGGTFTRRELVDGVLEATSVGVFSCAASVYHTPGAESTSITLPVDELTGRTYLIRDGGTPCQLKFETHRSGRCIEGAQVVPFEFDYVVNCNATSTVTIRFAADDYDEYRLNHTDEIFVRREIRGGELRDSDSGTFSESPVSPR